MLLIEKRNLEHGVPVIKEKKATKMVNGKIVNEYEYKDAELLIFPYGTIEKKNKKARKDGTGLPDI